MSDDCQSPAPAPARSDAAKLYRFLVAFTVCYLLFSVFALLMPLPVRGRFWYRVADLLHIPAFALLNFLGLLIVRHHTLSRWRAPIGVTVCVIGLSGLIEIIQGQLSRSASLDDLYRNSLGAFAALLIFKAWETNASENPYPRRIMLVSAFTLIALATTGPTASIIDVYRQRTQFPTLASFSSGAELQRWYVSSAQVKRTTIDRPDGHDALRVEYFPGDFPAIQLQELERDWTEYRTLVTELTHLADSPSESIVIQLRVADRRSRRDPNHIVIDRIELKRGETIDWRFDLRTARSASGNARLHLEEIRFIDFMAVDLAQPATVQYGPIRLEP